MAGEGASNTESILAPSQRGELRRVLAMSIPVVITTSSRALMDVVDFAMISQLGRGEAMAAILPAQLIMWSFIVIGGGFAAMVSTFAAQAWGRKEASECSAYLWQSLYFAAGLGALACFVIPYVIPIVSWIGHEEGVAAEEISYLRIALLTTGPTLAAAALGWFFIGVQRPWITTWSVIEANVVNIAVSYVLIFGRFGFESMGIAGAAWGTLAAVIYRTVRLGATLLTPANSAIYSSWSTWRPSWQRMKNLVRVGLPCSLHWFSEVTAWAVFVNVLIGRRFSTEHLIATNVVWQYMRIAFMPANGVGQALTSLVGKSIGEGLHERAIRQARIAATITYAYMGTLSVIYWLYGAQLISWFDDTPAVIEIGVPIMICAAIFQLFDAMGITYNGALRGAGDTFVPSMFFVISSWVVIIGGGWTIATIYPELGSLGPWMAASGLIVIAGVFLWWRWHRRGWMKIDIFRAINSSPSA